MKKFLQIATIAALAVLLFGAGNVTSSLMLQNTSPVQVEPQSMSDAWAVDYFGTELAALDTSGNLEVAGTLTAPNVTVAGTITAGTWVTESTDLALSGDLAVGNGTPDVTQDGEDAYVEGTFEVDGASRFDGAIDANGAADFASTVAVAGISTLTGGAVVGADVVLSAQVAEVVTAGSTIVPTGVYQELTSASAVTCDTTTCIAAGTTAGELLLLINGNASDTITIDGTGGNVECKADVVLGAEDSLLLMWDGSLWHCLSTYDNS